MNGRWGEAAVSGGRREGSLRELCSPIFRHKGKALALFVLLAGLVIVSTFLAPPIYQSEAKLLVKPGRESVAADPTVPPGSIMYLSRRMEEVLSSELEILLSQQLVETVVDQEGVQKLAQEGLGAGSLFNALGLAGPLRTRESALKAFKGSFQAEVARGTNILRVTFEAPSPALARTALNDMIQAYLDLHMRVHMPEGSYELLEEQTELLSKELADADDALDQFKKKVRISSLHDQRLYLLEATADLRLEAQKVAGELAAARAATASLQEAVAAVPETTVLQTVAGAPNFFMDDARFRLLELKLREKELSTQFAPTSRFVQNVRDQIGRTQEVVSGENDTRTQVTTGANRPYQEIQIAFLTQKSKLAALEQHEQALQAQLAPMEAELESLIAAERGLTDLERQQSVRDGTYREYVNRLEEARIVQMLERDKISNVAIVQPATEPLSPVKPRKGLNILLGLVLGILGGVGIAFLSDNLDHSFRSARQVEEHLGIPVLVSIPDTRRRALKV
jgi:uncharacterized protein involved in exopolysaccharide biosynthesis